MLGLILFILLLVVLAVAGGLGVLAPAAAGLVPILLGGRSGAVAGPDRLRGVVAADAFLRQ